MGCQHCGEDPCTMYEGDGNAPMPGSAIDEGLIDDGGSFLPPSMRPR